MAFQDYCYHTIILVHFWRPVWGRHWFTV